MALIFKLRDNDIVESRLDLEQSIINNLAVFFDALPPKFIYKISVVASITTKDGTNIKGASHQVLVSTSKTGVKKYKTVYNKWLVLDISVKTDGGVVRKLERIVLAPVNILTYNPTLGDLDTESNSINVLVQSGGLKLADYQLQNTTTPPAQTSTPASGTVPPVSNSASSPNAETPAIVAGAGANTLFEWYQAQGQTLPSVTARATIYEGLGLGPAGTYVGTTEQNNALLSALKNKAQASLPTPAIASASGAKILGSTQYYKLTQNGSDIYLTLPWGGNAPFGYIPISKTDYIAGLQSKLLLGTSLAKQYPIIEHLNGGTLHKDVNGNTYIGSDILDAQGITQLQNLISAAQNSTGIFAVNYNSGGFEKFQPTAPTPSEQYYTAQYFASLPASEQARLKSLYPASY